MKKLTLNKAWELCLKQWKWIVERLNAGSFKTIITLKREWCRKHGYKSDGENDACFFCLYDIQGGNTCSSCPARKIDKSFNCCDSEYHYYDKPLAFYKKLLSLNKKRLKGKK